ncbi:MAG: hypothetical protein DI611_15310 [Brachybacterium faecium]|nr:MAG: hypothetical protein DI611_15310 [Brachybacterium faecium]
MKSISKIMVAMTSTAVLLAGFQAETGKASPPDTTPESAKVQSSLALISPYSSNLSAAPKPGLSSENNGRWLRGKVDGDVELLGQEVETVGPEEQGGHNLVTTEFNTRFVGDGLQGNGYHVYLEFVAPDGSATSQGGARFVGSLAGREGSFIMESSGTSDPSYAIDADWCVVPGSGTDGFTGISGCGKVLTDGRPVAHYTFNYKIPRR